MNAYDKIMAGDEMLFVKWNRTKTVHYRLIVSMPNRKGELAKLLTKLSTIDLNVSGIEFGISTSDSAEYCKIEVESSQMLMSDVKQEISKKFKLIDIVALDDAYNNK